MPDPIVEPVVNAPEETASEPVTPEDYAAMKDSIKRLEDNSQRLTQDLRDREKSIKTMKAEKATLLQQEQSSKNTQLEEQGEWKARFESFQEQTNTQVSELQAKLDSSTKINRGLTVKSSVMKAAVKANAFNPQQILDMFGDVFVPTEDMTGTEINPEAVSARGLQPYKGGKLLSPEEFISSLSQIEGYQNLFSATGKTGAGAKPGAPKTINSDLNEPAAFHKLSSKEKQAHLDKLYKQHGVSGKSQG